MGLTRGCQKAEGPGSVRGHSTDLPSPPSKRSDATHEHFFLRPADSAHGGLWIRHHHWPAINPGLSLISGKQQIFFWKTDGYGPHCGLWAQQSLLETPCDRNKVPLLTGVDAR